MTCRDHAVPAHIQYIEKLSSYRHIWEEQWPEWPRERPMGGARMMSDAGQHQYLRDENNRIERRCLPRMPLDRQEESFPFKYAWGSVYVPYSLLHLIPAPTSTPPRRLQPWPTTSARLRSRLKSASSVITNRAPKTMSVSGALSSPPNYLTIVRRSQSQTTLG
jgi:hypothetical protein